MHTLSYWQLGLQCTLGLAVLRVLCVGFRCGQAVKPCLYCHYFARVFLDAGGCLCPWIFSVAVSKLPLQRKILFFIFKLGVQFWSCEPTLVIPQAHVGCKKQWRKLAKIWRKWPEKFRIVRGSLRFFSLQCCTIWRPCNVQWRTSPSAWRIPIAWSQWSGEHATPLLRECFTFLQCESRNGKQNVNQQRAVQWQVNNTTTTTTTNDTDMKSWDCSAFSRLASEHI